MRDKIVGSLVLLRRYVELVLVPEFRGRVFPDIRAHRKEIIDSNTLLTAFFPILVSTPSKTLRTVLFQKILSHLRNANSGSTDHRLNRTVQTVLYNLITSDRTSAQGIYAVKLTFVPSSFGGWACQLTSV